MIYGEKSGRQAFQRSKQGLRGMVPVPL